MHFADRLLDAITRKGSPVCVGIDPVIEKLPRELQPSTNGSSEVNINEAVAAITSCEGAGSCTNRTIGDPTRQRC